MYYPVSWNELHEHTYHLSKRLASAGCKPDCIVAVARGGLAIANILSDFIQVPVSSFTISTYLNMKKIAEPVLRYSVAPEIRGHHILLLDDIADSGETLRFGVDYIEQFAPKQITTATLYYKRYSKTIPDFSFREVADWVIFPFEIGETIGIYKKLRADEPDRANALMEAIRAIGLPDSVLQGLLED